MSNQEKPEPDDVMAKIQEAARQGAQKGYRLVLEEFKAGKPAR